MYRDIAKMDTATSGTGTITLGSAVAGFLSFANAGYVDGEIVTFVIEDGNNREISRGKYTASGTTLTRDTVLASTNSGSKISLSGSATVFVGLSAQDVVNVSPDGWIMIVDDFLGGNTTSQDVGQLGWTYTTLTVSYSNAEANHPGVLRTNYTSTSNGANMRLTGASLFSCGSVDEVVFVLQPSYTAGVVQNLRFGISDAAGLAATNHGAFIERLAADTDWYGAVMNGGSKTRTSSPLISDGSANGVWLQFKIRRISATEWRFSVNNGTEQVINSGNYPDDADMVFPSFGHYNDSGTTANNFNIDYFHARIKPRTRF